MITFRRQELTPLGFCLLQKLGSPLTASSDVQRCQVGLLKFFRVSMRVWYMGCALAFQAREPGSSPGTRFEIIGFSYSQRLFI